MRERSVGGVDAGHPGPAAPARMHRVGPALCAATVAGGLLALQSRVNGALTERVGSAVVVALSSFLIGLVTLLVVVAATGKWRLVADVRRRKARTPLIFTGGLGGAVIVTTAASAVPLIGVALLGVCLVAGQLAGSLVVDGVGVGPSGRHPITAPRVVGSTLAVAGVALSLVGERVELRPLVVAMVVLAGVVGAVQQAVNGRLQQHLRDTWLTATVNFAVGTAAVALVALVVVGRGVDLGSWPVNPLLYVGGPCGVVFVAVAATTVRLLGVLRLTLAVVAGQLAGGLLLDVVAPVADRPGLWLALGVAVVLAAVALTARPEKSPVRSPTRT